MTDVRLTATNPEDSSVVPVACNAKGELLLEEPTINSDQFVAKTGDTMSGPLSVNSTGFFASRLTIGSASNNTYAITTESNSSAGIYVRNFNDEGSVFVGVGSGPAATSSIDADGGAYFTKDVIVGSRGKRWMIVESNGIAHLVDQSRDSVDQSSAFSVSPGVAADEPADESVKYPALRNIPSELDMIEQALGEVMEKLRMSPPAGWPVWDGSDENL